MRINTNTFAINSQRNLNSSAVGMGKAMEKLSSGLRINRAADDAAGMSISEKLRAQARGNSQAMRNAQDGISLIQTAEGALNEVHDILQRINELALQGANDTLSAEDRAAAISEVQALTLDIDRIAGVTNFNGVALLSAASTLTLQVGAGTTAANTLAVTTASIAAADIGATAGPTDLADAVADVAAGATGANFRLLVDSTISAIEDISDLRSDFGAVQNRLEHVVANLGVAVENLSASESRIRDADMAAEMVKLTKFQILQQAGTAVLAQANQAPQTVLQLLR